MGNFILIGRGGLLTSICLKKLIESELAPIAVFLQHEENSTYVNLTELLCKNHNITCFLNSRIQNPSTIDFILKYKPDFAIVASLGEILGKDFLNLLPIFNVHMGVLPYYRGAYTNFWKIMQGHDVYGVTIHKMEEKIDSGNAIIIKERDFSNVYFASDFFRLNYQMAGEALVEAIRKLNNNQSRVIELDYTYGKYYRKHNQHDLQLDENEDVLTLHKKINRIQFYGVPTLINKQVYASNLLLYEPVKSQTIFTQISEHKFLLSNSTGVIEISTL
jgi:methionyl-tRNA formyltransferase